MVKCGKENPHETEIFTGKIFAQFPNTAGIVVLRDEEMVWEEYGNGCSASSRLHLYSVTKSVVCALVGIALEKGLLQSVDQPLHQFFLTSCRRTIL